MAQQINKLTDVKARKLSEPGMHGDGGGLYLRVTPAGTKSWIFRYASHSKTRDMGLGTYPAITLGAARRLAADARETVQRGGDPIEERRTAQLAGRTQQAGRETFDRVAARYIATHESRWTNEKTPPQWRNSLRDYALPVFGSVPVADVDTDLVLKALEPIWDTKRVTADRVRQRIEAVLDWAKARGLREGENPARWRGHLKHLLPAKPRGARAHLAAMDYQRVPAFMADLRTADDIPAQALEFCILTATRTGETLYARWDEIDREHAIWAVPAERMKMRAQHRVPLVGRTLAILEEMAAIQQSDYVFPGRRRRPLGGAALLYRLRQASEASVTVHGFRSSFRDWAAEATAFPREVCEIALAHAKQDASERAYWRGDLFEKRRKLMEAWATYCATERTAGDVVSMRRK